MDKEAAQRTAIPDRADVAFGFPASVRADIEVRATGAILRGGIYIDVFCLMPSPLGKALARPEKTAGFRPDTSSLKPAVLLQVLV